MTYGRQTDDQPPAEYISYNGLGRSPMIWGIPYMAGLAILCVSLLGGMLLGTFVGPLGWGFAVAGIPVLLFIKMLCTNDDKAVQILMLEIKWTMLKAMGGNAKFHGGTMTMAPLTYGRKGKNVKRYFKAAIRG